MMLALIFACTLSPADMCFSPGNCDERLVDLIEQAQRTIDVAIYSLNRKSIASALAKAAIVRGVKVRVLLDRLQSANEKEKLALRMLDNANIEHHHQHDTKIMHMKVTIVDGRWVTFGSMNFTDPAVEKNDEVISYLDCPDVAVRFTAEYETRWDKAKAAEQ